MASGNPWEAICIINIVEEIKETEHGGNAMESYSYLLSQASTEKKKKMEIVWPYGGLPTRWSSVLVLNFQFLDFKNIEIFSISPASGSGCVDTSENEKRWKNIFLWKNERERKAEDILIFVFQHEIQPESLDLLHSLYTFP